jgi:hypothetical protein
MAEHFAYDRQPMAARDADRREGMAKIVLSQGWQPSLAPYRPPCFLDVDHGAAFLPADYDIGIAGDAGSLVNTSKAGGGKWRVLAPVLESGKFASARSMSIQAHCSPTISDRRAPVNSADGRRQRQMAIRHRRRPGLHPAEPVHQHQQSAGFLFLELLYQLTRIAVLVADLPNLGRAQ